MTIAEPTKSYEEILSGLIATGLDEASAIEIAARFKPRPVEGDTYDAATSRQQWLDEQFAPEQPRTGTALKVRKASTATAEEKKAAKAAAAKAKREDTSLAVAKEDIPLLALEDIMGGPNVRLTDDTVARRKHPYALCEQCPMYADKYKYVPTKMPVTMEDAEGAVVGEAPGVEEVANLEPFVGWSGKVMTSGLSVVGFNRDNMLLTNAVACRPRENKLENYADAVRCCRPRLIHEINQLPNTVQTVIAVGRYAAETMIQAVERVARRVPITRERGNWHRPVPGAPVQKDLMITVHPAYVLRAPAAFTQFKNDLLRARRGVTPHPLQTRPRKIVTNTLDELREELDKIPDGEWVSFDIETEGTQWFDTMFEAPAHKIIMLSLTWKIDYSIIVPHWLMFSAEPDRNVLVHNDSEYKTDEVVGTGGAGELVGPTVGDACRVMLNAFWQRVKSVGHNAKFDSLFLWTKGYEPNNQADTMLMHYVLDEQKGTHGLKQLAADLYDIPDYEEALIKKYLRTKNDNYGKIPFEPFSDYAAWDTAVTIQLKHDLEKELRRQELFEWPYTNVIMGASWALTRVEYRGIMIDVPYLRGWEARMEQELVAHLEEARSIAEMPELNPGSPKQIAHVIYDKLGFKPFNNPHIGERSTSKRAIELVGEKLKQHPFILALMKYRRVQKILNTYVKGLLRVVDVDSRVHTNFFIHGTITGRLSSREPALQTIPRGAEDHYGAMIRGAFVAKPGHVLVMGDYSQAELRIWADLSKEEFLIDAYNNDRDLHAEAAAAIFGPNYTKDQRSWSKFFNFAYVYGGNEKSFAGHFQIPMATATKFVRTYEEVMPGARKWRSDVGKEARRIGYCQTMTGRMRRFPLITPETVEEVNKAAANSPIQGAASDLTLLSLIQMEQEGYEVVLSVHDSILIEVKEEDADKVAARLKEVMEAQGYRWFPGVKWKADVEVGKRWTLRPEDDEEEEAISVDELVSMLTDEASDDNVN
jgi:uracil-DNA glycosylase family 4